MISEGTERQVKKQLIKVISHALYYLLRDG